MRSKFYSRKTLELFLNPPNVGTMEDPDGTGEAINTACSDVATITIKVEDDTIADIKFRTQGCAASIAASAATTTLALGKKIAQAQAIDVDSVVEFMDGLPDSKIACSIIAPKALHRAIEDWRSRTQPGS